MKNVWQQKKRRRFYDYLEYEPLNLKKFYSANNSILEDTQSMVMSILGENENKNNVTMQIITITHKIDFRILRNVHYCFNVWVRLKKKKKSVYLFSMDALSH